MHAEGVYVVASKSEDEETSYLQAKVTLDYHRPNQMAIISTSESTPYNCRFIADDPFTLEPEQLRDMKPLATIIEGDCVYAHAEWESILKMIRKNRAGYLGQRLV